MQLVRISFLMIVLSAAAPAQAMQRLVRSAKAAFLSLNKDRLERKQELARMGECACFGWPIAAKKMFECREAELVKPLTQQDFDHLGRMRIRLKDAERVSSLIDEVWQLAAEKNKVEAEVAALWNRDCVSSFPHAEEVKLHLRKEAWWPKEKKLKSLENTYLNEELPFFVGWVFRMLNAWKERKEISKRVSAQS